MARLYRELCGALMAKGIDSRPYLAELMERSTTYLSLRFNNRAPWSQDDQYRLMDLCHIPYEQMHRYFPKDGRAVERNEVSA